MFRDIVEYVEHYLICQQVKAAHQRPSGLLQPLMVPEWKWKYIGMDFILGLPSTKKGANSIWLIMDRLTKSTQFLPVRNTYSMNKYAKLYIDEIIRFMENLYLLFLIDTQCLLPNSGRVCTKL